MTRSETQANDSLVFKSGSTLVAEPGADMLGLVASATLPASGAGYRLARGESALGGTNPTAIATGLTTVVAIVCTLSGSAAPGVGTSTLTYALSGGSVDVYAWKPTSSSNPTLTASTGTETFSWIAIGI